MAQFVRRLALSRRAFLAGAGVSVALPWLDAMVPAFAGPDERNRVARAVFVFAPNGMKMDEWTPASEGPDFALPYLLEPLAPHRTKILVLTGLAIDGGRAHGDGPGDHARSAATFLTCAHPKKTGGTDVHVGQSVDQWLVDRLDPPTPFPSLQTGLEPGRAAGVCDSGYSCAYTHHVSWRTPSQPLPKETRPRAIFARLFGETPSPEDAEREAVRRADRRSVLDLVAAEARRLGARLGPSDRDRLGLFLDSVREVERRIAASEAPAPPVERPSGLEDAAGFPAQADLVYELIVLALQTDRTRIVTHMLGNAGSNRPYPFLGVPEGHHHLSHHGREAEKLEGIRRINRWHVERFAAFLGRLEAAREAGESLLDRTWVVLGSGLSDGNRHNHDDLPVLVAGGGSAHDLGRHVRLARETPMADLYLSIGRRMGVGAEAFADSRGTLL